jgi:tetratricopeptide (TPR) repeat protein/predicted Ser/Thr protein kinase
VSESPDERALRRLQALAAGDPDAVPAELPDLGPRYEVVRELGRGGMGVVYEVLDRQLGRRCALKMLGAGADPEQRARFVREAAAAARLQHPHIAAVHDATPEHITMQLVAGGPIGCAPAVAARDAVALARDAALAVQHAHEQGIVHRDLKPSNLLVEYGHVYVVDFGLAKRIDAASSLSLAGAVVGTPAFMPPEQALGRTHEVDARSDVYALGATLHWCLTGALPFPATELPALLRAVVEQEPPRTGVDRDLDLVVAKCLAKEPGRRYASARELADDLGRWLANEPVCARAPSFSYRWKKRLQRQRALWRAAGVTALVAVAATALVFVPRILRESAARAAASEATALADHVATVLQDAELSARLGDHDSAQRRLDAGIARVRAFLAAHEVPRVHHLLARLLQAHSRTDEALAELDLAIAGDDTLADARFARGLLLAARGQPTVAERELAIADLGVGVRDLSIVRDVDRLFGKAELLRLQGEPRRAMELLREVLEYDPQYVEARLSLAAAARALGDDALSLYYAASAVDLQQGYGPFYEPRERRTLPTTMLDLRGALVDCSDELRAANDNALALAHRGLVHLRRALRLAAEGDDQGALEAVHAAIADHRTVVTLHDNVAGAHNNFAVCWLVAEQLQHAPHSPAAAAARAEARAELAAAQRSGRDLAEVRANVEELARREAAAATATTTRSDDTPR